MRTVRSRPTTCFFPPFFIKRKVVPFPSKLYTMLAGVEAEGLGHVVQWCSHGRAFMVHAVREFVEDILPRHVLCHAQLGIWYGRPASWMTLETFNGMAGMGDHRCLSSHHTHHGRPLTELFSHHLQQLFQAIKVHIFPASIEPLWLPTSSLGTRSRSLLPPTFS